MSRKKISSGAKWENIAGYSRAIRVGNRIIVGGTTAVDENSNIVGKDDMYAQTTVILQKIRKYIEEAGAKPEDVVSNRIYVTDISKWVVRFVLPVVWPGFAIIRTGPLFECFLKIQRHIKRRL
jgi:enamine deaminase RidA (YjgF/YER057c/UK114 family)